MAQRKKQTLEGAGEFLGPDPEKDAIDKITAARAAAAKEAEQDSKKGDNGGPILDKDAWRRATNEAIAEDLEIEKLQEQMGECRGRLSSIRKVAKSLGVDWDVVSDYRKKAKRIRQGEMGAMVTEFRRLGELMGVMDCPLYTQFNLFKLPEEATTDAKKVSAMDAELMGDAAWRNNEPESNNPFQANTDNHVLWQRGFREAMAVAANKMAPGGGSSH